MPAPALDAGAPADAGSARSIRPPFDLEKTSLGVVLVALAAVSVWSLGHLEMGALFGERARDNIVGFMGRAMPIEFPPVGEVASGVLVTLAIVIAGTALSSALSAPIAFWAARNTTPHPVVRNLARGVGVLSRSIPEIVFVIVLISVMHLGPLPAVVGFGLHSIGMISKLYADAIEQIDEGPVLAIRAAGGSRFQQNVTGVLPQVAPSWIATSLHRLDINLRGSVLLGWVNVKGIGYDMHHYQEMSHWGMVIGIAIIFFVMCVLMEIVSSTIRGAILKTEPTGRGLGARLARRAAARRAARAGEGAEPAAASSTTTATADRPAVPGRTLPPMRGSRLTTTLGGLAAVAIVVWSWAYPGINWADMIDVWTKLPDRLSNMFPLSLGSKSWEDVGGMIGETVLIALAATLIGLVLSLVIGSLAARNVAPNAAVRAVCRGLLVGIRGIPELIMAIIFIVMIGMGPAPGALALGIAGVGLLGKLIADSMEEVAPGPEVAARAAGATRLQVYATATLPQAAPAIFGHLFYLIDHNVRSSTVLGIVGGGGVGFWLFNAVRLSQYDVVLTITVLVVAVVLTVELVSMWVRRVIS
ncbi:phosphonate ABC transporter, permease protein PhnE [Demequina pelophila]|uniref:phosphonate ABC transporter, permease protein PhnE n=1 Tax=Demequina pelophila TaxID=1638984 RepID=UPI0007831C2C|nr:phosphonate ABC transporter, permease protein PhnE [Demequina pelophila]